MRQGPATTEFHTPPRPSSASADLSIPSVELERALHAFVDDSALSPESTEAVRYALGLDDAAGPEHRGKRVRPVLCLTVGMCLGGDLQRALPLAVACEVLHAFLLVHDDIADGDTVRRGRPALWSRFGLAAGINVGDLLAALTYRALLRAGWEDRTTLRILRAFEHTLIETGEGQALDLASRGRVLDRAAYDLIAEKKTGYYLAMPMQGAALLAGAPEQVVEAIGAFGAQVGPMFQIIDDLIDISEGKGRLARGNDIREGKCSLLTVLAFERANRVDHAELLRILRKPRPSTLPREVAWAIELFAHLEVEQEALDIAAGRLQHATAALRSVPETLRGHLTNLATSLLHRKH